MSHNTVFIELGGNVGDRLYLINQAKLLLQKIGCEIVQQSSIYETPPWGFEANQNFYNQIIKVVTNITPINLMNELHKIEIKLGRVRGFERYESRTMDLDILFYDDALLNDERLTIPHPRLHQRKFVLVPMLEIAPNFVHPLLNLTIHQLFNDCSDTSECTKVN